MEVTIRLQRTGKRANKHSNYRVVAISKATKRDGRNLDILGYYDPSRKISSLSINLEKIEKWVKQGAQLSDTVRSLVKKIKKSK